MNGLGKCQSPWVQCSEVPNERLHVSRDIYFVEVGAQKTSTPDESETWSYRQSIAPTIGNSNMRPENMDEWTASDWSFDWEAPVEPKHRAIESDDTRLANAKDITPDDDSSPQPQ